MTALIKSILSRHRQFLPVCNQHRTREEIRLTIYVYLEGASDSIDVTIDNSDDARSQDIRQIGEAIKTY